MDEEVVHVETLTCFMVNLPTDVEDGGMEMVNIIASHRALKVIRQNAVRELKFTIELTKRGFSRLCLLYSVDSR